MSNSPAGPSGAGSARASVDGAGVPPSPTGVSPRSAATGSPTPDGTGEVVRAALSANGASRSMTSAAVAGRSAGSFSRSRATTAASCSGISPRSERTSVGCCSTCWLSTSYWVCPSNGGAPTRVSYSTQPRAYRSAAAVTACWRACSGAMYLAVPTVTSELVRGAPSTSSRISPTPKSSTFTTPSAASITLDGLRSRCTTPARCAASRPLAICAPIAAAHATGSWPLSASASTVSRVIPSMYSIARYGRSPSSPPPMMRGRFGLDSRSMIRTSRMNRAAFLSASVSDTRASPERRRRSSFTATVSPVWRSRARWTSPMLPRASGPISSNRPAITSEPLMPDSPCHVRGNSVA